MNSRWTPAVLSSTGFDHPACFANGSACCVTKISAEHYVSESILKLIGNEVIVKGTVLPERSLKTKNITANILCKRHNETLSPLDAAAKCALEWLKSDVEALKAAGTRGKLSLVNGGDFEYFLLKMLCGLVSAGVVTKLTSRLPNPRWLKVLFGQEKWAPGWGLYVDNGPGVHDASLDHLRIGINLEASGQPKEVALRFGSWLFSLYVGSDSRGPTGDRFRHRPTLLVTQFGTTSHGLLLNYSDGADGGFVRTTIHGFAE